MFIEISQRTFFDRTSFELTDLVRRRWSSWLKGGSNLFDLWIYPTYPDFDLSGVFSIHNAY